MYIIVEIDGLKIYILVLKGDLKILIVVVVKEG